MTIDTRCWGWCSLGPLAPGSPATISDSYVQGGGGIISTRGTVTLAGIYRPAVGTPVSLAISDGQRWIARVPRRLRVLSSLADPLRGITTVSVGCLFALYENRRPPDGNLQEAEQNADVPEAVRRVAALPITAAWVTQKILTALGLTAAGAIPFTIARVVDEWDLSAGYVEELGRIAASGRYRCWINGAEQVQFIPLNQEIGTGPLLTRAELIDFQPVNVGDLPGEAVIAKFSSLKLVPPDAGLSENEVSRRNWERERVIGGGVQSIHSYQNTAGQTIKEFISYNDVSVTETTYDGGDRVIRRVETSNQLNGTRRSETTFRYANGFVSKDSEDYSRVVEESSTEWTPTGDIAAACGKNGPHAEFRGGNRVTSWRVTQFEKENASGITLTRTIAATAYISTPFGSDAIAKLREAGEPLQELIGYASRLTPYGSSTRIRTEREFGLQKRPGQQERNRAALAKVPNVEQIARSVWALGSPAAETVVELSPPYVSDDRIVASGSPVSYSVVPSGAEQQALAYAQVENRLLLAHRNGVGLQLLPIDLPAEPFGLFYLRLNGSTGAFRVNGATWTIGADGAVCGCDALFWGAIDGTAGSAWFPLPPGLSTLPGAVAVSTNANPLPPNAISIPGGFNPTTPNLSTLFASLPTTQAPTPAATANPAVILRPWNETVELGGGVRVGGGVSVQPWIASTVDLAGGVRVGGGIGVADLAIGSVATEAETFPMQIEQRAFGGDLAIGTVTANGVPFLVSLTQAAGPIVGDVEVSIGTAQAQAATTLVQLLRGAGPITGELELSIGTGQAEARTFTAFLAAAAATGPADPDFASVDLLIQGITNITDASLDSRALTITGAAISTAQARFGPSSIAFDGTNDEITFGSITLSPPYCVDAWFYLNSTATAQALCFGLNQAVIYLNAQAGSGVHQAGGVVVAGQAGGGVGLHEVGAAGLVASRWYHLRFSNDGTTERLFIDGSVISTKTTLPSGQSVSNGSFTITKVGASNGGNWLNGYVTGFRLTGGAARSTEPFSVPTAPWPER